MVEKLKTGYFKVKSYWNKPPRGYEVCYKEFMCFAVGSGGMSFLSVMVAIASITATADIMVGFFKVSSGSAFILATVLGSIIALIRAPILSMIIDNSNGKLGKGKFKPLLMWSSIAASICFVLIPFIPQAWVNLNLFTMSIPELALFQIKAQTVTFSVGIIVMFALVQIGTFFYTLFTQAMMGIEQTISTVAQERANVISIKSILANLPGSVINMLIPIFAGIFFATTGHMKNINLYKFVFPIAAIGGLLLVTFMLKTKERVVVNKKYKAKVNLWQGVKDLSKNKYFWIITIFNSAVGIRNLVNIVNWVRLFSYEGNALAQTIVGLFNTTLLMSILIVGMATAPALIKLFGKKKVMIYSCLGSVVMILFQLLVYKNPVLILISSFFQNVFTGFGFVSGIMVTDVLDYQQWKTGRRLEGFWQNYTGFIGTILGIFVGMISPLFLSFAGVDFGDELDTVLKNVDIRDKSFFYMSLAGLIGAVVCLIPMLFYNLDEKKHKNYVRALKIRAAADNYEAGDLTDDDIVSLNQIVNDANEIQNMFVLNELSKHDCIEQILLLKDGATTNVAAANRLESMGDLQRDLELEEKRIIAKLANAKMDAGKKHIEFDEVAYELELKQKSRIFRHFQEGELSAYQTVESIFADMEKVYDIYSVKVSAINRASSIANFKRKLEKQNVKITEKLAKAKAAAEKKQRDFNEESATAKIKSKTRYFKHFTEGELAQYPTIDVICENIETVYDLYKEAERVRNL